VHEQHIDELAIRLARAHYTRTRCDEAPFREISDLLPGIAQVWRTMALTTQDVLGIEGVAHAMSAMDNIGHARAQAIDRTRDDRSALSFRDHLTNVFTPTTL
jgi:hypothetical protein